MGYEIDGNDEEDFVLTDLDDRLYDTPVDFRNSEKQRKERHLYMRRTRGGKPKEGRSRIWRQLRYGSFFRDEDLK